MFYHTLEEHADIVLKLLLEMWMDQPMRSTKLYDAWGMLEDSLGIFDQQQSVNAVAAAIEDYGDAEYVTLLRFYLWKLTTNSALKETLAGKIRKAWNVSEYVKEQVGR